MFSICPAFRYFGRRWWCQLSISDPFQISQVRLCCAHPTASLHKLRVPEATEQVTTGSELWVVHQSLARNQNKKKWFPPSPGSNQPQVRWHGATQCRIRKQEMNWVQTRKEMLTVDQRIVHGKSSTHLRQRSDTELHEDTESEQMGKGEDQSLKVLLQIGDGSMPEIHMGIQGDRTHLCSFDCSGCTQKFWESFEKAPGKDTPEPK